MDVFFPIGSFFGVASAFLFTSDGHGLLEGDVLGDAEAVDEAALVGGKVVLADELVPLPRPRTLVEDAQT